MTYELAKQFKESFPFLEKYQGKREVLYFFPDIMGYEIPTLSELIEACGDRISSLERQTVAEISAFVHKPINRITPRGWFAVTSYPFACHDDCGRKANAMYGSTPEKKQWLNFG